ncbi:MULTISPECIES: CopD family protein [Cellulophaga]|jgi:putative membrane protein|uniref:Protoporphyrinogen IX oxidase n=2 Tax=Cellulophaga baltica TaxID=76594 RepID=A0A1G7DIJ2_9FLAO|nr:MULTISPECIES: CopD family protein [Cellulophaga]WFO14858.1 CopD family protein [Cellulophaga baltica 4]AIY12795.1 protoporphyrinogen IX oxidase [Cellulophaga baltica NN016038]AIZ41150.1 protoporphyrinogen IX oxidase [Cellulophaga baltica 18]KGK32217.1 protoporphyrinogen IX oxidase [Cellulophaga sp. E6(2014)]MBA6313683.1 CopD family protein [Cellulophaga baltica]
MTELYGYIKALHLIFVITWFAGLFYVPRLFINHIEASLRPSPEKEILTKEFKLMTKRLWYIITWPSAILAIVFAIWLLVLLPAWLQQPWMHVKLAFVVLLILYHLKNHQIFKQLQRDDIRYTSNFMRIWNEGATIILFAVVFLVVLKSTISWVYGVVGIIALGVLLMLGIKLYKRIRAKNPDA